jgi:hypothetical protein
VDKTIVRFCLYLSIRSQIARRANGSTPKHSIKLDFLFQLNAVEIIPAVGSSKITVVEFPTNAIAIESFRFIPPDNSVE